MNKLSEPFDYDQDYSFALNEPISFWDQVATKYIHWDKKYESIYSGNEIHPEWFKGGKLNLCFNLLDIHVNDPLKRDQIAIIFECPFLNQTISITYKQLYERVCEFSRVLLNLGIEKNDIVFIHMPNSIEAIIAILSCNRVGCIYYIILECLSSKLISERLQTFNPKLVITSSYGITTNNLVSYAPFLIEALEKSSYKPSYIISYNRKDHHHNGSEAAAVHDFINIPNSLDWDEEVLKSKSNPFYDYVKVESNDAFNVIYTSGTTGNAKPIVRDTASFLASIKYYWDIMIGDDDDYRFFTFSAIGWITCQIYLYSILSSGNTLVLYEGCIEGSMDKFWSIVEKHKVNYMYCIPRLLRYTIKMDPNADFTNRFNLKILKSLWIGSDVVTESDCNYIQNKIKITPVVGYGQTELGLFTCGSFTPLLKNSKYSSPPYINAMKPFPFVNVVVQSSILLSPDDNSKQIKTGEMTFKLPTPPGFAITLYKDEQRYLSLFSKYKGYYATGDLIKKLENGFFTILSRTDDTIKIGPIIYELVSIDQSTLKHPLVLDCCCIGLKNHSFDGSLIGLLVLKDYENADSNNNNNNNQFDLNQLKDEINTILKSDFGLGSYFTKVIKVSRFPKSKAGKVQRSVIASFLDDPTYKLPNSFEDIEPLNEIYKCLNGSS